MKHTIVLILLLTLAACTLNPGSPAQMNLTQADNGRSVELSPGEVLVLSLESNPTTGYTWEIDKNDSAILQPLGEPGFTPESKAMGAPGQQVFRFKAAAHGQTSLTLIYHRSWEKDVPPAQTFSIEVVVR